MEITKYQEYYKNLNEFERKYAPKDLFWEGDFSLLTSGKRVSIVGSRKASDNGIIRTKILTCALVQAGIVIVSGLAEGIDTAAHKAAIECKGKTIAVLGTPLSRPFPAKNKELLFEIKKNHLAISQFPNGYGYDKSNFPMRNRTMALISDATIIVEAGEKSGTRHQAWEALRLGRLVFILENVLNETNWEWVSELMSYGAQVLTRKSLEEIVSNIPNYTSSIPLEAELF